jgi:hypothetical protein
MNVCILAEGVGFGVGQGRAREAGQCAFLAVRAAAIGLLGR